MVRSLSFLFCAALLGASSWAAAALTPGDLVRVTHGEMLQLDGKNFLGAAKGQEFTLLQQDPAHGLVSVAFYKKEGAPVSVTLPADAVEALPHDGWLDLLASFEAFRDQRPDAARQYLAHAAQDEKFRALATALAPRLLAALTTRNAASLQMLRETATQLEKLGYSCLALALDQGTDQLGGASAPPTKLNRDDLTQRVATSTRALARTRQAVALRCLTNATEEIETGLKAEPARPELKAFQIKVQKDIAEAGERYADADRMRRFFKGTPHALTALEMGLKLCADHPQLLALKKEMSSAFEERTSPPVNAAFLTMAGGGNAQALTEGHTLYTNRCTECHDLELLDSKTMTNWQKAVAGMSRRAGLDNEQQAKVLDYIAAAQKVVEATPEK